MTTFTHRLVGAARLEAGIYEELEADRTALRQALGVVLLSSLAAGIGSLQQAGAPGLVLGALTALLGWMVWAGLIYVIGTRLLPGPETRADYGELLRTLGFASAPGIARVLGLIPGFAAPVFFLTGLWMLAATVVAVRQALDYRSTWRALGVCAIGWLIHALLLAALLGSMGGAPPAGGP